MTILLENSLDTQAILYRNVCLTVQEVSSFRFVCLTNFAVFQCLFRKKSSLFFRCLLQHRRWSCWFLRLWECYYFFYLFFYWMHLNDVISLLHLIVLFVCQDYAIGFSVFKWAVFNYVLRLRIEIWFIRLSLALICSLKLNYCCFWSKDRCSFLCL